MKFKIIEQNLEKDIKKFLESNDAQDILSKANGDDKTYTIKFKITNESTDRDGETIIAKGINWDHFDKNPVILIDHKYTVNSIAGKALKREVEGNETYLTVQLAKGVAAGELVKTLHEQGMIKGVSIGFMPLERKSDDRAIITKSEALEASFVAIGSNREALIEDQKLLKKCLDLGMIKEEKAFNTQTVNATELRTGDIITYRYIQRFTRDGVEVVEVYPNTKKLPRMGMIIQKLDNNEEVLKWNSEAVIATKEDPIITIQGHIASEDGAKGRTMNIEMGKYSNYSIEKIVPKKDVEKQLEEMKKEISDDEIDNKDIMNMMKELKDDISSMKQVEEISSDDKEKIKRADKEALKREKAQKLAKAVSSYLEVSKS